LLRGERLDAWSSSSREKLENEVKNRAGKKKAIDEIESTTNARKSITRVLGGEGAF
jgi:hypothetical protein